MKRALYSEAGKKLESLFFPQPLSTQKITVDMTHPHISVLLQQVLDVFQTKQLRYFVDGTLGAGGHSEAILKAHPEIERLIGIDQDPTALAIAKERLAPWKNKLTFVSANFSALKTILKEEKLNKIDGMLLDLGVSSMQFDQPEKGFSFMREGPLDMRMNPNSGLTAFQIINEWPQSDLERIFRDYGEEKLWRLAARVIIRLRKEKPITTTVALAEAIREAFPYPKKGIHPATLIFQALRIAVNDELGVLERTLPEAIDSLSVGGRLAVITFHSLEDRIVKNIMRSAASDKVHTSGIGGLFLDRVPDIKLLTRKPLIADEQEVSLNPRSRSAKLRSIERL